MSEELKLKVFAVVEGQLPLKAFEAWLYDQEGLSNRMNEDFILALYSFNYNQRGAKHAFKNNFLQYFDEEEFMLWKVKADLAELANEGRNVDRILYDFYMLGCYRYPFLFDIGVQEYNFSNVSSYRDNKYKDIEDQLKKDASCLLQEIETQEKANSKFNLTHLKLNS